MVTWICLSNSVLPFIVQTFCSAVINSLSIFRALAELTKANKYGGKDLDTASKLRFVKQKTNMRPVTKVIYEIFILDRSEKSID